MHTQATQISFREVRTTAVRSESREQMASSSSLLPRNSYPDTESCSSSGSGGEEEEEEAAHSLALEDSIFRAYIQTSSRSSTEDLSKIRAFLLSSRSNALSCLICLLRIKPSDPVWSCRSSCFAVFHLFCIQTWARSPHHVSSWHCPKCRSDYPLSLIPSSYLCFCGKSENPVPDPWIFPHSCGEICGRALRGNCGHSCLLLCHPGPCPPCPKLVSTRCFCGGNSDVRRCALKKFSCGGQCSRVLECGSHRCTETCHEGDCPPCRVKGLHRCLCEKAVEERECFVRKFRCENPCGQMLGCGKHVCERGCHGGKCGGCPLQGKRTCPCGKKEYVGVDCDAVVPTCGSTCEKMLGCGLHRCPERCHRGTCVETCRIVQLKSCRCGSLRKEVPCYQDLVCERKCQRVRDCGRHACRRRCCDGGCLPCSEICGRKLRCNNHKCLSPCHRGSCAPCPLMVSISCSCGETNFEVPCGTEAGQKPPRCPKKCRVLPLCRHGSRCKPHKCHYGACPLCQLICEEELPCGHKCKKRCHGPRPAPKSEFSLKPKKAKLNQQSQSTPGSPCLPCQEVVSRPCLGQHIGAERLMLCSDRAIFRCSNLCGNLLQCGNHYCEKPCHLIKSSPALDQKKAVSLTDAENISLMESCDECLLPCQKDREPACPHPCPLPCHTGNCPPCKVLVKRSCHCRSMVHVFECTYYNNLPEKEQQNVRSCGGPCHRKLPNCPHLCPVTCHLGECPSPEKCLKKVIVRCACQNLKKEWLCQDVQAAYWNANRDPNDVSKHQFGLGLLSCNVDCARKLKVSTSELQFRKPKVESQVADAEKLPKRRRRRGRVQEDTRQLSRLQEVIATMRRCLVFLIIAIAVIATAYFCYKGLYWLSDRMNEADERKRGFFSRI